MQLLKTRDIAELNDNELLMLYKQNQQQEVLAQLFLKYNDLVYGTCMKYLENPEVSKDAVMNIYAELVTKVNKQTIENFKSWLYVVTKNHCLMELRKNKKVKVTEFDGQFMQIEDYSHQEDVFDKEEQLDKLDSCIEKLNNDQKETIKLFYLDHKCYNEITNITGYDFNKVRSLIQNGKRNLKICMEKNG